MDRTERQDDSAAVVDQASAPVAYFRLCFGEPRGAVFAIGQRGVGLGREAGEGSDCVIADTRMSRRHARIERAALGFRLCDLGSRNGGFIDGVPFPPGSEVALTDGAVVRLGDSIGVFRHGDEPHDADSSRDAFPGTSPEAANVRRRLRALAEGRGHVLILGETGTGKERVARAIGEALPGKPFVPVNCAEISRDIGRSELFGHVRGAFSGAATASEGLVAKAADGVLLLDEVGELSLDVQADLLRFLEDGCYRPIGSAELRSSPARVVAATNLPLDEAVSAGRFRRDLLARLRASNAPLELPPLRDRREDILAWADTFLRELGEPPAAPWSAGAAECLVLYAWPENLRELRGVVRALAADGVWPVPSAALPERVRAHRRVVRSEGVGEAGKPASAAIATLAVDPTRAEIERVLASTHGRVRTTAEQLGVDRRRLYRLCEKLEIDLERFREGE